MMDRAKMSRTELAKIKLYREFDKVVNEVKKIADEKNVDLSKYIITNKDA